MSAWAKIQTVPEPLSFAEITSEQLAESLQEKEILKHADAVIEKNTEVIEEDPPVLFEIDHTESDAVIANLLQLEFNNEHDIMLKRNEQKCNGNSKVNISYMNFRARLGEPEELNIVNDDDDEQERDIDRFVSIDKEAASIPRCGYKKVGEGNDAKIITKHDILMDSRINARRVLEFPPGIQTGDTGSFDVKLNNKVYNTLRRHSHNFCSRERAKAHLKPDAKTQVHPK